MTAIMLRRPRLGRGSTQGIKAVSQTGIVPRRHDNARRRQVDVLFRWGCTAEWPEAVLVVNTAESIMEVNDKSGFRRKLEGLCPVTWYDIASCQYPCVVRPHVHAQGRELYVCHNEAELRQAIARCGAGWYASELIQKVAEYRVFVAQGRAVWVARKTPGNPDQVAWNVARGGRFDNVGWGEWPLRVVKHAIQSMERSKLDFGGVDVMVGGDRNPYTLEINSAPSQTSPYRQGCVAKVFDRIHASGSKAAIPLIEDRGGWRKFIHPAVSEEAQ